MSPRTRLLVAAAVVIGALALGGQAQSQTPATASIVAAEGIAFTTPSGGAPNVTITAGGIVAFSHAAGPFAHNVNFTGTQPASCVQTVFASASGPVPPLPSVADSGTWAGSCTFTAVGTYTFNCALHGNDMTGSVTVVAAPPPPPPPGTPPAPPPPPPPPPSSGVGAAASALRIASRQRGTTLRGSVRVRSARSRLLARAFARRGALSGGASTKQVRVGRQLRSSVGAGRVSFAVKLTASARRALRRNGRLAITFRLTVTPPSGASYTAKRSVVMRPSR